MKPRQISAKKAHRKMRAKKTFPITPAQVRQRFYSFTLGYVVRSAFVRLAQIGNNIHVSPETKELINLILRMLNKLDTTLRANYQKGGLL
jgi:hypothetical protein